MFTDHLFINEDIFSDTHFADHILLAANLQAIFEFEDVRATQNSIHDASNDEHYWTVEGPGQDPQGQPTAEAAYENLYPPL